MSGSNKQPPRIAVQHVAAGMLLMAIFTLVWAGIADIGLRKSWYAIVAIFFSIFSLLMLVYALYLFIVARTFPVMITEEEKMIWKRIGIWYGIILGSGGLFVSLTVGLLISLRREELIIPSIAFIIGIHLFPLSRVFKRTIDYYLATWTCLVALGGIFSTWYHFLSPAGVLAVLGIGLSIATSSYGLMLIFEGFRLTES